VVVVTAVCKTSFAKHQAETLQSEPLLRLHAAGEHKDAVGVCAREMGDPQLALFLARLLDGKASPAGAPGSTVAPGSLLRGVISRELLPGLWLNIHCALRVESSCRQIGTLPSGLLLT
jgi:hypothetical protein